MEKSVSDRNGGQDVLPVFPEIPEDEQDPMHSLPVRDYFDIRERIVSGRMDELTLAERLFFIRVKEQVEGIVCGLLSKSSR